MSTATVAVVAVIIAWVIGRQLAGEPLRAGRLIGSPVVLTVISVIDVATSREPGPTVAGIVLVAVGLVIAGVTGVSQGRRMRLESRHGYLWGQMPASVLWLWAAYFTGRGAVDVVGYAIHARLATGSAVLLLGVGVNRLAQAAVVAPRAFAAGVPFAPETGKPLAGLGDRIPEISGEVSRRLPLHGPEPGEPVFVGDPPKSAEAGPPRESQPPRVPPAARPGLARQAWRALVREITERAADALK